MSKLVISIFLLLSFNNVKSSSQTTDTNSIKSSIIFKDTAFECTVVASSGKVYKDAQIFDVGDSTLKIKKGKIVKEILIEDIRSIKFYGRGFGTGALIGGATGFVIGLTIGGQNLGFRKDFSISKGLFGGLIVAIPFTLIGGGIGALFAKDQFFNLSNLNFKKKKAKILFLMKKYS